MSSLFKTQRLVEFRDTDMGGVMHFSSLFCMMAAAGHELLRELGLSVYDETPDGAISFPRVSARCDYQSPARCEDVLDIEVTVTRVGEKSVTYDFTFFHQGKQLAQGQMTSVCCRIDQGKPPEPIPIPEAIANKLKANDP